MISVYASGTSVLFNRGNERARHRKDKGVKNESVLQRSKSEKSDTETCLIIKWVARKKSSKATRNAGGRDTGSKKPRTPGDSQFAFEVAANREATYPG